MNERIMRWIRIWFLLLLAGVAISKKDAGCCDCTYLENNDANTLRQASLALGQPQSFLDWSNNFTCQSGWTGVCCDASGRVLDIILDSRSLNGYISPSLGNLKNLRTLSFANNLLTRSIPSSLGNLKYLLYLDLAGNLLNGSIPSALGNLTSLIWLGLHENALSGPIPTQLGNIKGLTGLHLGDNRLNGSIPTSFGEMRGLIELYLYNNALSGPIPPSLGALINLKSLDLYGNQVSGSIPLNLGYLKNLQALDFEGNSLSGAIPSILSNLTNLTWLSLARNVLTGPIPSGLGFIRELKVLKLNENKLNGSIPSRFGEIRGLTELRLDGNALTGPIPLSFGMLGKLEHLNLGDNQLSGSIPTSLSNLKNLQILNLNRNFLSGSIPSNLGNLTNLTWLDLHENTLSGPIPPGLVKIRGLNGLQLNDNKLNGSIPSNMSEIMALKELYVSNNALTGVIPSSLGSILYLEILALSGNRLSGPIPPSLGNLKNLKGLNLEGNLLSGFIPSTLGNLTNLTWLNLADNRLSGSIPSGLGNIKGLAGLLLGKNKLYGPIPSSLSDLKVLKQLHLHENALTGPIPPTLGRLANLEYLSLSKNLLSGTIPPSLGNLKILIDLDIYGNLFNGSIPSSLGNLANLNWLSLADNALSGFIPSELGNIKGLYGLFLHENALTGPIPPTLQSLPNLEYLYLAGNSLNGSITSTLSNLTNLISLELSRNALSGPIPSELGNIRRLKEIYLSGNAFTGTVPPSLGTLSDLETLYLDDNLLTGFIPSLVNLTKLQQFSFERNYLSGPVPSEYEIRCQTLGNNFRLNCLAVMTSICNFSPQHSRQECVSFCNVTQPGGVCGGHGFCYLNSNGKAACSCDKGYNTLTSNSTCELIEDKLLGLSYDGTPNISALNRRFRYASSSFEKRRSDSFSWTLTESIDWGAELGMNKARWPVKDQGPCASCWVFSVIGSIESAYAITNVPKNITLSEQQVLDCQRSPLSNCSGGWPSDSFQYASTTFLQSSQSYKRGVCSRYTSGVKISQWEEVDFGSILGLLISVQQQPIVVAVEASGEGFQNYANGVFSASDCYFNGVDHSILLVGYNLNLNEGEPYWILRNSWGSTWGDNGYMKLAIRGGPGVCGINTLPGFYPIIAKPNDPCKTENFGTAYFGTLLSGAGTVQPCGRYGCQKSGTVNVCKCTSPFVALKNLDGTQTCIPENPCAFYTKNPCVTGTCVAGKNGTYNCVCPLGYTNGTFAYDGQPTCVQGTVSGQFKYVVPLGSSIPCNIISQEYGISTSSLVALNQGLNCNALIPGGTQLTISTTSKGCTLPYVLNQMDNCSSVATLFGLRSLAGPGSPNPFLNCSNLIPGQQVCIVQGTPPDSNLCVAPYLPKSNETCSSIIKSQLKGNASNFFGMNVGLYCDRLFQANLRVPVQSVCLRIVGEGSNRVGCKTTAIRSVQVGDTCPKIYRRYFSGKMRLFVEANSGATCPARLRLGFKFCIKRL